VGEGGRVLVFFSFLVGDRIEKKKNSTSSTTSQPHPPPAFSISNPPPSPTQLNRRGYNIGCRLVDDFLAKSRAPASACAGFRQAIDAVARGAFRAFLGVTPRVSGWNDAGTAVSLLFDESPLTDWVELPRELAGLRYQNLLAGAVRGGLEQVGMATRCEFVADSLDGDDRTELRVTLLAPPGAEAYPFKDED
jgi:trafficking protein particle complex subunit 3